MADKNKTAVNTSSYERPKELGAWEGTKTFLWNGETGQFMGRTGGSWGKFGIPLKGVLSRKKNVGEEENFWKLNLNQDFFKLRQ
jgi:hypothetical protein